MIMHHKLIYFFLVKYHLSVIEVNRKSERVTKNPYNFNAAVHTYVLYRMPGCNISVKKIYPFFLPTEELLADFWKHL